MTFTEEQVAQLAPDASSLKAGKDLANERKWLNYQLNDRVLWGEVQGSGKDPYRTQIDLRQIAFKCSCPSRKFPCKHGLGLLFLVARKNGEITRSDAEPTWVNEWITKRSEKAETKVEKEDSVEIDSKKLEKQAKDKEKRQTERLFKVQAGVAELDLWIRDMVRTGFVSLPEKGTAYFEKMAARLIDAQATGLATMVKEFTKINFYAGTAWQSASLALAAKIHLQIEAFKNLEKLPPLLQEEIKSRMGWNLQQKELLEGSESETLSDDWLIIGRKTSLEDDITVQKNWLYGCSSKRYALILNFAYKNAVIETLLVPASITHADLVFYPSNLPFRAIIKQQSTSSTTLPSMFVGLPNWEEAQHQYASTLAQNPWADDVPQFVENLMLVPHQNGWLLKDVEGTLMELSTNFDEQKIYHLLAIVGGKPFSMFALRHQNEIEPLGILLHSSYQLL